MLSRLLITSVNRFATILALTSVVLSRKTHLNSMMLLCSSGVRSSYLTSVYICCVFINLVLHTFDGLLFVEPFRVGDKGFQKNALCFCFVWVVTCCCCCCCCDLCALCWFHKGLSPRCQSRCVWTVWHLLWCIHVGSGLNMDAFPVASFFDPLVCGNWIVGWMWKRGCFRRCLLEVPVRWLERC